MRASQIDITCNIIMKSKNALLVHITVVRSAYTSKLDSTHILNILVSPLLTSLTIVSQGQPFIVSDKHNLEEGWSKIKAARLCSQCFEIFQHISSPTLYGSFVRFLSNHMHFKTNVQTPCWPRVSCYLERSCDMWRNSLVLTATSFKTSWPWMRRNGGVYIL